MLRAPLGWFVITKDITFRAASQADTDALIGLKWGINKAEYAAYPADTCIPSFLDLSREAAALGVQDYWDVIAANGGAYLVGEMDQMIVCAGCWYGETAAVSTLPQFRNQAGIGSIIVAPSARGLGLGKLVMERLEGLIRAEGIDHVRLTVVPGNIAAEKLYHSMGFEDFETVMVKSLR
jgi:ribosomal protein S18 acetylase RimI-like enzyme